MTAPTPPPTTPRLRRRATRSLIAGLVLGGLVLPAAPAAAAGPATYTATGIVSTATDGTKGTQGTGGGLAVDGAGRWIAFDSRDALVPEDTNGKWDVYLRDRRSGRVTRASLGPDGEQIAGNSHVCALSPNALHLAFWSDGLTPAGAEPGQLFVRDRSSDTVVLVSASTDGAASDAGASSGLSSAGTCSLSDDGRYTVFASTAGNLAPGDANGLSDVFWRDRVGGVTKLISRTPADVAGNGASKNPVVTATGLEVVFESTASDLVAGDTNGFSDIFIRPVSGDSAGRMNLTNPNQEPNGNSTNPSISADASYIAFESTASDLVADDTNGVKDVFVRRRTNPLVTRASLTYNGNEADGASGYPDIDATGAWVSFTSAAGNLYPADGNGVADVFRRDLVGEKTDLVSRTVAVAPGNQPSDGRSVVSNQGRTVTFGSLATNLTRHDANGTRDVYTREYARDLSPFTSVDAFVSQQFTDLVGRAPSAAERTEWKARLANGEAGPEQLVDEAAHGTGWAGRRAPVTRLYWAFFQRIPDLGGLDYWVGRLAAGKKLSTAATQFSASSEFQSTYGALANPAFVTLVYQNVFDRDPDAGGLAFWTKKLDQGQRTRGQVVLEFSESNEGRRLLAPQTDIVLVHVGLLRKMPAPAAFADWLDEVRDQGRPIEDVILDIRLDPAYAARVTP